MNAEQIIELIRSAEKKTPVKVYLWEKEPTSFPGAKEFPAGPHAQIVFGDWKVVAPALEAQKEAILDMVVENQARNSAVPLLDTKNINARIEPGAIIRDQVELELHYHYHEFNKIVVFLSGKVTYVVEGKSYFLQPWDVLLVPRGQIHWPSIDPSEPYERIILWINSDYLEAHSTPEADLLQCFRLAEARKFALLRLEAAARPQIRGLLGAVEDALISREFGSDLWARSGFLQFMVAVNRIALRDATNLDPDAFRSDPKIEEILSYINENLDADLSLDAIAERFYISKSYLMHRFKEQTGCSAHKYVRQKRLLWAAALIRGGVPVVEAGKRCGFGDYSSFLRAFKQVFGATPSEAGLMTGAIPDHGPTRYL